VSIIVFTSASGSPGVTTTTLGLSCTWPRQAIAVEADPVGGSSMLAGYFRGFTAPSLSLVDLLMAHRGGRLAEQFPESLIRIQGTNASVLPGPRSHAQAYSALELWEPLAWVWRALESSETDVLIDAGRLGMESFAHHLLQTADLVVLVTRTDLPSLAAARQWAERAAADRDLRPESAPWTVVAVGDGRPYSVREVSSVLGLPVVASLGVDPRGAAVYSVGATRARASRLQKDLVACGQKVREMISDVDRHLAPKEQS